MISHLANTITLSRIALSFLIARLIFQNTLSATYLAIMLFTLASLTDYWDGLIARKYSQESAWGKLMDPIADKFLVFVTLFSFSAQGKVRLWMVCVMLLRELGVTYFRFFQARKGNVIAAKKSGKVKTVLQMVAIYLLLLLDLNSYYRWIDAQHDALLGSFVDLMIFSCVLMTISSGWSILREHNK